MLEDGNAKQQLECRDGRYEQKEYRQDAFEYEFSYFFLNLNFKSEII